MLKIILRYPTIFCWAVLNLFSLSIHGQERHSHTLAIESAMPDVKFSYQQSGNRKEINFASFRGKFIILDFWNIWCASCISAMPKLDSLQKQFGSNFQIILITKNSEKEVTGLFKRIKIPRPDLPMIVSDSIFNSLFPHSAEPFHAWINDKGIVKHITEGYNTTALHINDFIANKEMRLSRAVKNESLSLNNSLFEADAYKLNKNIYSYSILLKEMYEETISNGFKVIKNPHNNKAVIIRALNVPVLSLYTFAFSNLIYDFEVDPIALRNNSRIIVETRDKEYFQMPSDHNKIDDWKQKNIYAYELFCPIDRVDSIFSIMQTDINKYFPYYGRIEKRKVKCIILVKTGNLDMYKSKDAKAQKKYTYLQNGFLIQNMQLSESIVKALTYALQDSPLPLINETNYYENLDLKLEAKPTDDIVKLKKALHKVGLDLLVAEREINMLIISNKTNLPES